MLKQRFLGGLFTCTLAGCSLFTSPVNPEAARPHYEPPAASSSKGGDHVATNGDTKHRSRKTNDPADDERRAEVRRRAWAAVALDGHPKGKEIAEKVVACKQVVSKECLEQQANLKRESIAAVDAGLALKFVDANPDAAEGLVSSAERAAEQDGPGRRVRLDKEAVEDKAIKAALVECEKNRTPCKQRCDKGEVTTCVALGFLLWSQDNKFDEAKPLLTKGCDANLETGCDLARKVVNAKAEFAKSIDTAWSSLVTIGDDLATKKFLHAFAAQHLSGPRSARATQNMAIFIEATTKDSYCPAVNEFLAVSTRGELALRAKTHCNDDPPTATGLAGKQVELGAECKAVYAIACPAQ